MILPSLVEQVICPNVFAVFASTLSPLTGMAAMKLSYFYVSAIFQGF